MMQPNQEEVHFFVSKRTHHRDPLVRSSEASSWFFESETDRDTYLDYRLLLQHQKFRFPTGVSVPGDFIVWKMGSKSLEGEKT